MVILNKLVVEFPLRGGGGGGESHKSEFQTPLFHVLSIVLCSCLCPCCSYFNLSLCHVTISICYMSLLQNHVAGWNFTLTVPH